MRDAPCALFLIRFISLTFQTPDPTVCPKSTARPRSSFPIEFAPPTLEASELMVRGGPQPLCTHPNQGPPPPSSSLMNDGTSERETRVKQWVSINARCLFPMTPPPPSPLVSMAQWRYQWISTGAPAGGGGGMEPGPGRSPVVDPGRETTAAALRV